MLKKIETNMSVFILALFLVLFGLIPTTSAEEKNETADMAQVSRGAKAWADHCGRCHNLRDPAELTDEIWDVSVNHMHVRANIPFDVIRDIKFFLKSSN